ncbi:hybrid sensor histidine kinase/response regulator [Sphingomonas spermidinifaciens]|uniref:histidine kinase n=1 Tax=Sphingomonas spermidinifaciens TaxID=1141889 RepID=A0A2A4B3R2_9SPHN|nr:ATP-binding protein [Sphingomonas spermidinifaciens]PCD02687.1 hybrid sensor histidine kinase/response regulator [Sphingomonas spermidinifaciens]
MNPQPQPQPTAELERYRALFETMDEGFCVIEFFDGPHGPNSDYVHVLANPAYERNAGIPNVVGQKLREMVPDEADGWVELYGTVLSTGQPIRFQRELVATGRFLEVSSFRLEPATLRQVAVLFKDVSDRARAEAELRRLNETLEARVAAAVEERATIEEALRQSQKMEAVGQLTGGLAHDFNNLLAGISGSLELAQMRISQGRVAEVEKYLLTAQGATRRAAALTHRLLAFARRQTLLPRPVNVNRLVAGMIELIQRTVGPSVAIENVAATGLWTAMVDASQLENALLNLCINARDAMPEGGRITIETCNRWIDAAGSRQLDMPEGQYLSLCVSDTGTGMTPEVRARAFDPFFTTKPIGEGTGLGLSMIYGFAKQSGGQVRIYSEPGEGTMVCIYLPRHLGDDEPELPTIEPAITAPPGAGETVLVVDDEPSVRLLIVDVLHELGYAAIEAADGASGLRILESGARIDLLVTDVGLPGGMNGRQLADAARARRPGLHVLFITGFAENALLNNGQLEPGMQVLTKPFAIDALASRIRQLVRVGD